VPRTITDAQVEEVVVRTLEQTPQGGTHWSKRELAKVVGISPASVLRIWHAFGLQPWRTETFKISPDPFLIDKIRDVVGLYLAPPANAVVFAMDEKPQIQALERTAPVLPMIPGVPERRSFDYVRHGTVDLFAALNTATGKVITKLSAQHRAVYFRDFLDEIDRQTDKSLAVHVICDNLSAHKAPVVHKWLLAHPRFQLHFTPTYSSWINQVERWFAELERRCQALQMDQDRRPDPRPRLPLLRQDLRTRSLAAGQHRDATEVTRVPCWATGRGGTALMGLERGADQAHQQIHVRVAVEMDGHPARAGDQPDRGRLLEIVVEPLDGRHRQMQVHVPVGVEVHDLALDGAQGPPCAAMGRARAEVGPDFQSFHGALGRCHDPIVTRSPRRNQRLSNS
jgi:hypothetical protein